VSTRLVDDFTTAWAPDASGHWTTAANPTAAYLGDDGSGMLLSADGTAGNFFAQRVFTPALDLRDVTELRFWLRAGRAADPACYLAFEAGADPAATGWQRLVRVERASAWELHRMWLGDMPAALRRAVAVLRFRAVLPQAFSASVDDLWAGTPEGLRDTETALLDRLGGRFSLGGTTVPALIEVPADQEPPYLTIRPFAVRGMPEYEGQDVVDNVTAGGACVRPHPRQVRLDYRIDVAAADHAGRTRLVEAVVTELARDPRLSVFAEPLRALPFDPDPVAAGPAEPGVTPLYYRVVAWLEVGDRTPAAFATPFLVTSQPDGRRREVTPV
jgi:hypothetical protein